MSIHVLVPIDESERASDALEHALEEHGDAHITALHVINPQDYYPAGGIEGGITTNFDQIRENYEQQAERLLDSARETASEAGVEIDTDTVVGTVARSIIEYTEANDVDHIVIGSHGRSGASRILLGSVAETVTRRSPVPVTIVR